jgi:hypothetical protein
MRALHPFWGRACGEHPHANQNFARGERGFPRRLRTSETRSAAFKGNCRQRLRWLRARENSLKTKNRSRILGLRQESSTFFTRGKSRVYSLGSKTQQGRQTPLRFEVRLFGNLVFGRRTLRRCSLHGLPESVGCTWTPEGRLDRVRIHGKF